MKKQLDVIGHRKYFFGLTLGVFVIGIIFLLVFQLKVDIQFTGGAIVSYSYSGELNQDEAKKLVEETTGKAVSVTVNENVMIAGSDKTHSSISFSFSGNNALSLENQKAMTAAIEKQFPDNNIQQSEANSVDPTMGKEFFLKCMVAIILAGLLMVVYVALRFRKIGGWSAGVMALVALVSDVITVFFTFVIFRLPLDSNFIAVALMILGYSLNDTIVIYDRIRENRRLMGPKVEVGELVNTSINQNLSRTINTSLTTFSAVAVVFVVSLIFNLPSVTAFALPMMIGVISGCYSTNCIAGPLWVMWQRHKKQVNDEKNPPKGAKAKA